MDFFSEDFSLLEEYLTVPLAGWERRAKSLTDAGEALLLNIRNARRMELYWPLLWERIRPELEEKYPLASLSAGTIPAPARQDALRRALDEMTRDGGAALWAEYPELARMDRLICEGFVHFLDEVFKTLEEKRGEIADTLFGGRDFGRVTAARLPKATDARTRPGARTTLLLETEGGRFYFKPRVCAAERLYARLMERFFPDVGTTSKTVVGERASFAESIEPAPLASEAEAREYYRRMGVLTAIFFILQTGDLHSGNFIAQGPRPAPVDLEILLGTQPVGMSAGSPRIAALSMLRLDGESEHHSPLYARDGDAKGRRRLPQLDGRPISVLDEEDAYLAGFADGYHRVMDNSKEWTDMIRAYPDMPLRVLLRSHRTYGMILRGMVKPARLRSAEARDAWLERAWANIPEARRGIVREMERSDFLGLDFPDFIILAGDTAIRRPDGTVALDGALRAPMDCAAERLSGLSEEELSTALEDLRGIFNGLRNGSL